MVWSLASKHARPGEPLFLVRWIIFSDFPVAILVILVARLGVLGDVVFVVKVIV